MSKIPSPAVTTETAQFWSKANEGQLSVPQCRSCGKFHWYPRAHCPFCTSHQVELKTASGRGTIYTYTVMRTKEPYCVAYVELDEGVRVFTNIVDCDLDALKIGQKVKVVFKPTQDPSGPPATMFTPV